MSTSIPSLHVSSRSSAKGSGTIFIDSRKDAVRSGKFSVRVSVSFDPATDLYPGGSLTIKTDLTEDLAATFSATTVDLINSYGKLNPTIIFTGRCKVQLVDPSHGEEPKGCKYWLILVQNRLQEAQKTPDIVGFVITDRTGSRVAYGTGPVESGTFNVVASS